MHSFLEIDVQNLFQLQLKRKDSEADEWNPLSNIQSAKSYGPFGASS